MMPRNTSASSTARPIHGRAAVPLELVGTSEGQLGRKDRRKNFARAPALRRADIEMGGGANGSRRKGENQDALLLGAPHHYLRVWQVAG